MSVRVGIAVVPDGLDMEPFGYQGELEDESHQDDATRHLLYHVALAAAERSWPAQVVVDLAERLEPGLGARVARVLRPNRLELGDVFKLVER